MRTKKIINVYEYTDYRTYLHDFYNYMKGRYSFFSYRYFMAKATMKSPYFLKSVMDAKKNLSKASVFKFANALNLNSNESRYFFSMVWYNQSKTPEKKQHFFEKMQLFKRNAHSTTLDVEEGGYFSKWYYPIVRELVVLRNYQNNWREIAQDVVPQITALQAKKTVYLLLKLGLLKKNGDGTYSQTSKNVTTGKNFFDIMDIRQYHKKTCDNAKKTITIFPTNQRFLSSLVLSMSKETYDELLDEISEFCNRLTCIANKEIASDRVYQMSVTLFPTSFF